MSSGAALVDACGQVAHGGHVVQHLDAHEEAASAGLGALPHNNLQSVGPHHVVGAEAVAAGENLIDEVGGFLPLLGEHATVAGAGGRACHGGTASQGCLGGAREGTVAHAGDIDRSLQQQGVLGVAVADNGSGVAPLLVALEGEACEACGEEDQVVEVGDFLESAEPAHSIATDLRLGVYVVDHPRRPNLTAAHYHSAWLLTVSTFLVRIVQLACSGALRPTCTTAHEGK